MDLETAFFNKFINLISKYLQSNKYQIPIEDQTKFRNEIIEKANINIPKGLLTLGEHYVAESFMKKCFSKCRQFVLKVWIDYDELDCTMNVHYFIRNPMR